MKKYLPKNLVLKMQRQKFGIIQQTVADRCNIHYSQYQKFESGSRDIMQASFVIAFRILTFLQINIDAFIDNKYGVDIANNLTIAPLNSSKILFPSRIVSGSNFVIAPNSPTSSTNNLNALKSS